MTRYGSIVALAGMVALASPVAAQPVDDPLHGFCWGSTPACTDNGKNTPTATASPNFLFDISPGPNSGDYVIDVLIPNNVTGASSIAGLQITGGATSPANANLAGGGSVWHTGDLGDFLGLTSSSPANPIGAFLDSSETAVNPGATGFYVYQADLGINTVSAQSLGADGTPKLQINANLPTGAYLVSFLSQITIPKHGDPTTSWIATAPSGAILETGGGNTVVISNQSTVPEPSSLAVLAVGLLGLGLGARRHSLSR